jgi:hypothetical protein
VCLLHVMLEYDGLFRSFFRINMLFGALNWCEVEVSQLIPLRMPFPRVSLHAREVRGLAKLI